jgi:flagellar basal-body rod protein FlgF/flagellar basal-body rod protein FlgG
MPYGLYISAEGASAQQRRLEVIANNMANSDTVGFKQDVPSFQARFAEAIQRGLASPGDQSINNIGGGVKMYGVATNFSEGQFSSTGKDLDFAIAGNGFFHVQQDDGKVYLSRAGDFSIDATGRLVTSEGQFPVLDQQDSEMTINPDLPWYVTPDGFLVQDGGAKAIGLSQPKSLDELQKVGNNMFRPTGKIEPVPLEERDIRQGYLELSGSNPINQMMAMIEATRGFEANSRMIQAQDTAIGTLVGRVLRS